MSDVAAAIDRLEREPNRARTVFFDSDLRTVIDAARRTITLADTDDDTAAAHAIDAAVQDRETVERNGGSPSRTAVATLRQLGWAPGRAEAVAVGREALVEYFLGNSSQHSMSRPIAELEADRIIASGAVRIMAQPGLDMFAHAGRADVGPWRDRHGDVWELGQDGLLHSPETAPFPREHVERKWGPLIPVPADRDTLARAMHPEVDWGGSGAIDRRDQLAATRHADATLKTLGATSVHRAERA